MYVYTLFKTTGRPYAVNPIEVLRYIVNRYEELGLPTKSQEIASHFNVSRQTAWRYGNRFAFQGYLYYSKNQWAWFPTKIAKDHYGIAGTTNTE